MTNKSRKVLTLTVLDGFARIAIWQAAGFTILLLLVWFNELTDVPALLTNQPASPPDLARGCLSSAGVLFAAIVTIGQTYLQQRNIVSGMLTICCYCHKIRVNESLWQRVEEYIGKHSMALFSHGVCPECFRTAREADQLPEK